MDLASEKGAVTAEFMLLLPALILLFAFVLGSVGLSVERIALESTVFTLARQNSIGLEIEASPELRVEITKEGRLECVSITKQMLVPISSKLCLNSIGD